MPKLHLSKTLCIMSAAVVGAWYAPDAQSSGNLTMYGRLVNGINYQTNQNSGRVDSNGKPVGERSWSMDGNVWGTSMLGFRGEEDLGGGLRGLFVLENGFDASTGASTGGSGLWTRRALVGMRGAFGTLKLGRNLSLPTDHMWKLDPSGQQAMGTATLVKGRNWHTYDNQIDYTTPDYQGFTAQFVYGLGEQPGSARRGSTGGLALAYVQPYYELRAMYDVARDQNGQYASLFQYSRELSLGGHLYVGKIKLLAGYQHLSAPDAASGPNKARHVWIGANHWITPAIMLLGGAYHVKLNRDGGTARMYMLGANYYLSRQTLLYASVGTLHNDAKTDFAIQTYNGGPAQSGVPGATQRAFYSGISFSF